MIPDRAYVLLRSGRRLALLNPDPDAWTDEDLATGLVRTSCARGSRGQATLQHGCSLSGWRRWVRR